MTWQLSKMMDVGTGNPVVARLTVGLFDIIQVAQLSDEKKEKIRSGCFEIMKTLVEAEKSAKPLMDEMRAAETKLLTEGVQVQQPSGVIETPGITMLENSKVFLKFAKQALQILAKTMGTLLDKDFNGR